jgi:hypothetical protein
VQPCTEFEKVYPVILLSSKPQSHFQKLLSESGYLSIHLAPKSTTKSQAIQEIRQITKSLYVPIFVSYGMHCVLLQKYLESWGCSACVYVDPVEQTAELADPLWKSLTSIPVKLESCEDTLLSMLTVAQQKPEIVDRLKTEFIAKTEHFEQDIIKWMDDH